MEQAGIGRLVLVVRAIVSDPQTPQKKKKTQLTQQQREEIDREEDTKNKIQLLLYLLLSIRLVSMIIPIIMDY